MLISRSGFLVLALVFGLVAVNFQGYAQTTFTYQGSLTHLDTPATGQYDFKFRLYDAQTGGNQVGAEQTFFSINVIDGLFSLPIDFGPVFDGTPHWLEVSVRTASTGAYTVLAPRQIVSPAPEAIFAQQADMAKVATTATVALNGVPAGFSILGDSQVPPPGYTWTNLKLGEAPHWEALPSLPSLLGGPSGALIGSNFYVISSRDFLKYDTITATWTNLPDIPTPRRDYGRIVAANGNIYVLGGESSGLGGTLSTNEMYNPETNTWTTKASMPTAAYSGDACAIGDLIYYFDFNATQVYNTLTDSWSIKEAPPSNIYQFFDVAVYNGKCYCFGGNNYIHIVYDPAKDDGPGGETAWSTVADLPASLYGFAAVTYKGKIYCLGGNGGDGSIATVEVYDPVSNTWESGPPMLKARYSFAADADNTGIYVAGGLANGVLSDVERFFETTFYVHVKN